MRASDFSALPIDVLAAGWNREGDESYIMSSGSEKRLPVGAGRFTLGPAASPPPAREETMPIPMPMPRSPERDDGRAGLKSEPAKLSAPVDCTTGPPPEHAHHGIRGRRGEPLPCSRSVARWGGDRGARARAVTRDLWRSKVGHCVTEPYRAPVTGKSAKRVPRAEQQRQGPVRPRAGAERKRSYGEVRRTALRGAPPPRLLLHAIVCCDVGALSGLRGGRGRGELRAGRTRGQRGYGYARLCHLTRRCAAGESAPAR